MTQAPALAILLGLIAFVSVAIGAPEARQTLLTFDGFEADGVPEEWQTMPESAGASLEKDAALDAAGFLVLEDQAAEADFAEIFLPVPRSRFTMCAKNWTSHRSSMPTVPLPKRNQKVAFLSVPEGGL